MTTHTPGPWEVLYARYVDSDLLRQDDGAGYESVRFVSSCGSNGVHSLDTMVAQVACRDDAQNQADARLIAAAPDLLATLKAFPGFTDDATVGDKWIKRMRAVIAQAEGRK